MKNLYFYILVIVVSSLSCDPAAKVWNNFNLFPVQDDLKLGLQVSEQIESDPEKYPILPEQPNIEAYRYIRNLTNTILNSGKVQNRDAFAWEVKIIDDDEVLNAFCTPGGYIYVYTGLIKFLDTEDELAGVMGHEIAHAALRHSTSQMTKLHGLDVIRQVITKNAEPSMIESIATNLIGLKFSRYHESQADFYSVEYLCATKYNSAGAAGFFEKMEGQARQPAILSTHPDPGNRVKDIKEAAKEKNCSTENAKGTNYQRFKDLL